MTAYVGAKVVYGPVKMVNGSNLKPTATGTFHVYYKRELQTMRGSNADGSKYETPDVPWISYFHRRLRAARRALALVVRLRRRQRLPRCVNLPVSVAKWVYDFAPIGTTVVSHQSPSSRRVPRRPTDARRGGRPGGSVSRGPRRRGARPRRRTPTRA